MQGLQTTHCLGRGSQLGDRTPCSATRTGIPVASPLEEFRNHCVQSGAPHTMLQLSNRHILPSHHARRFHLSASSYFPQFPVYAAFPESMIPFYPMLLFQLFIVISIHVGSSLGVPLEAHGFRNITIVVPDGTQNHSDPHLLCTPTKGIDVAAFFLANYLSHAATAKTLPGETMWSQFYSIVFALLFPTSGVFRGLRGIFQHAVLAKSPLEAASRAEALCVVVRSRDWKPRDGDRIRGIRLSPNEVCATICRDLAKVVLLEIRCLTLFTIGVCWR